MGLSGIINYIKNLLSKKRKRKKTLSPIKEKPLSTIDKPLVINEESEEKNNKFKQLLEKLENPEGRAEIIREQRERDLKIIIRENGDWIRLKFNRILFIIDKEGLKVFNEGFNIKGYSLCIVHSKNGKYLARRKNSTDKEDLFHRFIMKKEIELFQLDNNVKYEDIVIHHIDFKEWNNKKINLEPLTIAEHDKIHSRTK